MPILIQPQMGYSELRRLMYEVRKDEIFTLKGLFKIMSSLRSIEDLKRYWAHGKEFVQGRRAQ